MAIAAFDKRNMAQFRQDFMNAVADLGNRHGVLVELGALRFTATEARGKLTLSLMNPTAVTAPVADKFPSGFPLTNDDIGKTVKMGGSDFRIDGYNPAKRIRCVKLTRIKDSRSGFVSNAADVLTALGRFTEDANDTYPGDWEFHAGEKFDDYANRTDAMLAAIPRDKMIRFPIADGHALYYVESLRPLRLKHIPYGDAYRVLPATLRGLRTVDVEQMIARDRALAQLFAKGKTK